MSDPLTPGEYTDPTTPAEWQAAVDCAQVLLLVDSAKVYGLITGGPQTDVDRCLEILAAGATRGVLPSTSGIDRGIRHLAAAGRTGS